MDVKSSLALNFFGEEKLYFQIYINFQYWQEKST